MNYNIGDIIKINPEVAIYHIIIDYEDFSDNSDVTDVWYQAVMIYPISEDLKEIAVSERHFKGVARYGTDDSKLILDLINKERAKVDLHGEPSYISTIKHNLYSYEKIVERVSQVDESVIEERVSINLERITSVDEGLDLMNHFAFLAKLFGGDDYLKVREMIKERLMQLK